MDEGSLGREEGPFFPAMIQDREEAARKNPEWPC